MGKVLTLWACFCSFCGICAFAEPPSRAADAEPPFEASYADGHSRPRALLYNPQDRLLYVALSSRDEVAAIDVSVRPARLVTRIATGHFPQTLELLPGGDVLVVCRYDALLGIIAKAAPSRPVSERYRTLRGSAVHGMRGAAVHRSGRIIVATPAISGLQVIDLEGSLVQTVETGIGPRVVRIVSDPRSSRGDELLLVSNFLEHAVDVHPIGADGHIGSRLQRLTTHAPVQDFLIVQKPEPTLLLLTHEDRPVDRSAPFVAGMDSVVLALPARNEAGGLPFIDLGSGQRKSLNLSEHQTPIVKLDALAFEPQSGRLAIVGAATDNLFITTAADFLNPAPSQAAERRAKVVRTGSNPVAAIFLPDGRVATADRLSDTVSLISASGAAERVTVGVPARSSDAELGELLFFSRALVPKNVATGERSLYTCSSCHDDAHVDGRLHPAKLNHFQSMTKTCRGIGSTAPYLFLGQVADIDSFSANLLASHAQGSERGAGFDVYSTTLRLWRGRFGFAPQTLGPAEIRRDMAAYLRQIPPEPSPFLPLSATELPAEARRGLGLFKRACASCHRLVGDSRQDDPIAEPDLERRLLRGEVALTSTLLYDVGTKVLGRGGNNPPSLRGLWDNAPYFSDGSARTIDEVLLRSTLEPTAKAVHGHELGAAAVDADSRAALLAFLRCL